MLLVVLLGMADTLMASASERTRELGIARAVGARPRHLQRMVLAEGLLLAALGLIFIGMAFFVGSILLVAAERFGRKGEGR